MFASKTRKFHRDETPTSNCINRNEKRMKKPSNYLDEADLINLELYEYHGGEYSYIDTILNPFWLKVAYAFPNWYAPNLITLTGLIVNMVASLLVAFCDPMLIGRAPAWVYVNAAICLQIYAILDAADGKQARRLNASSPLGQIFDHGCDAVNLTFIIISCLSAAGLMIGKTSAAVLVFMYFSFVTAQLVEYQSNVLLAGSKVFGVTEAMLLMTIMMLITAFCGVDIWNVQLSKYLPFLSVFGDGVPGKNLVAYGMIIAVTLTCFVFGVQSFIRPSPIPEEKRGNKNLDRASYLLRFVPQTVIAACGYYLMTSDLMATHSLYVICKLSLIHI